MSETTFRKRYREYCEIMSVGGAGSGLRTVATAPKEEFPRQLPKPWGYEIRYASTEHYEGKILHVRRGQRLSVQYHVRKDESCYLLSGRLLLTQGPSATQLSEREIGPGTAWCNLSGVVHTIEALEDSDVLEVSTPHLDDVVYLQDNYGREGTSKP
jgi:mannose-6-phosphate isomerase-like protein (cupin superfamily)